MPLRKRGELSISFQLSPARVFLPNGLERIWTGLLAREDMDRIVAARVLGVPADAPSERVVAAFRRRAKSVHPDQGGSQEAMYELVQARSVLLGAGPPPHAGPRPPVVIIRTEPPLRRLWRMLLELVMGSRKPPERPSERRVQ